MIFGMIILGIVGVGAALVVGAKIYERRIDEEAASTADWVETEATILGAGAEDYGRVSSPFPCVAFSYSVKGEYFSGRFFLKVNKDQFSEQMRMLVDQKFPIQYDPADPSKWLIAESTIAGFEVISGVEV